MLKWLKQAIKSKSRHPGGGDGGFGPPLYQGMGHMLDNPDNVNEDFVNDPDEIERVKREEARKKERP